MTISNTIENYFSSTSEIIIYVTPDYRKRPSAFGLVCVDKKNAIKGYSLLHENYKDKKITILLHQNGDKLDISFVIKETADAINIKNLKYDINDLKTFLASGNNDQRIAFILSDEKPTNGGVSILSIPEMLSPILLDKYSLV